MRRLAVGFLALLLCSGCDTEEALRLPKRKTKEEKEAETAKKAEEVVDKARRLLRERPEQ